MISEYSGTKQITYPFDITVRLNGPQTLYAVSYVLPKYELSAFSHLNKDSILTWAQSIDGQVEYEMNRKNDLVKLFNPPNVKLNDVGELILACSVTKNVTHIIPTSCGVYVINKKSVYVPWIGLDGSHKNEVVGLQFDKDDGFNSSFYHHEPDKDRILTELNGFFNEWKNKNYQGDLFDKIQNM